MSECGKNKKLRRCSVATIDGPEFINVTPANPLISQCEIKVFYLGKNRNGSFIDKETATQMANTLPCAPIVAAFREDTQDFGDHGDVMVFEDGEIKFSCKTRPYGFVAPDAKVWFQKFIDTDEFGIEVEREYLMTTGYLWTGQYEEAKLAIEEGRSQSMELDPETLDGHWANDSETGLDFFIINDATFSKLCILGESVEPCFEGASVTSPDVSSNFTKDDDFVRTLFAMMTELKDTLSKGGLDMPEDEITVSEEEAVVEPTSDEIVAEEEIQEPALDNEPDDAPVEDVEEAQELAPADDEAEPEEACDDEGEFEFTVDQYNELVAENEAMKAELESLRAFKLSVEDREKDQLIAKYFMLDDEDKAEIVAHKSEYTLAEIEAKLALIYVNKNVDFSDVSELSEPETDVAPATTFNLDEEVQGVAVDAITRALRATSKKTY